MSEACADDIFMAVPSSVSLADTSLATCAEKKGSIPKSIKPRFDSRIYKSTSSGSTCLGAGLRPRWGWGSYRVEDGEQRLSLLKKDILMVYFSDNFRG